MDERNYYKINRIVKSILYQTIIDLKKIEKKSIFMCDCVAGIAVKKYLHFFRRHNRLIRFYLLINIGVAKMFRLKYILALNFIFDNFKKHFCSCFMPSSNLTNECKMMFAYT